MRGYTHKSRMQRLLQRYHDGELTGLPKSRVDAHLECCADCRESLLHLAAGERVLRALRPETQSLSTGAAEALLSRALMQAETKHRRGRTVLAGVFGSVALAGVLAVFWRVTSVPLTSVPSGHESDVVNRGRNSTLPFHNSAGVAPTNSRVAVQTPGVVIKHSEQARRSGRNALRIAQTSAAGHNASGHFVSRRHTQPVDSALRPADAHSSHKGMAGKRAIVSSMKVASVRQARVHRDVINAEERFTDAASSFDLPAGGRLVVIVTEGADKSRAVETANQNSGQLTVTTGDAKMPGAASISSSMVNVLGTTAWTQCTVARNAVGETTTRYVSTWTTGQQKPGGLMVTTDTHSETTSETTSEEKR